MKCENCGNDCDAIAKIAALEQCIVALEKTLRDIYRTALRSLLELPIDGPGGKQ